MSCGHKHKKKTLPKRKCFFLSLVSKKELGENRGFLQFLYHFNNSKNISIITAPQAKPIIIELTNNNILIHFFSTSFLNLNKETAKKVNTGDGSLCPSKLKINRDYTSSPLKSTHFLFSGSIHITILFKSVSNICCPYIG